MKTTFREFLQIQENMPMPGMMGTNGISNPNVKSPAQDPKVMQAVQAAKQALTSNPLDPNAQKTLMQAKDTLKKAKLTQDRMDASSLIKQFDPAQKNMPQQPQVPGQPQQPIR